MITLATFDLLDQELTNEVLEFRKLNDDLRWDSSEVSFHFDPTYWDEYYPQIKKYASKKNWKTFKFSEFPDLDKKIKTNDIGIYMFIIKPDNLMFGLPQFVMYVGISGEGDSKRPLKERLSDYFNFNNIKKRSKLHRMLKRYYHHTYIVYMTIKKIKSDVLEKLEEDFHGFFIPPAGDRDYPVRIKKITNAQFTK